MGQKSVGFRLELGTDGTVPRVQPSSFPAIFASRSCRSSQHWFWPQLVLFIDFARHPTHLMNIEFPKKFLIGPYELDIFTSFIYTCRMCALHPVSQKHHKNVWTHN